MPTVKACGKCGEVKPLDEFHKDKSNRDGRRSRCKECVSEYYRRYREENRGKIREYSLRYNYENREERREYKRLYDCENRKEVLERARRYRYENREVLNAKTSSYRVAAQELSEALSSIQAGTPWSEEEDAFLMADNGMTVYEKATHLGRTYNSCATRRRNIRLRRTTNV